MRSYKIILTSFGVGLLLAFPVGAQTTNAPATIIENLELQTGTIIVKGFSTVGTVSIGNAVITVGSKESSNIGHGQKTDGIAIGYSNISVGSPGNPILKYFLVVDYDELDTLSNGIDYLVKITYDVTPLAGFEASYTSKSGLRISAHSDRRQGGIQKFVQFGGAPKILFNSDQLLQLRSLIMQAKTSLDAIK